MSPREELLQELRPVSFAIAYQMLGSVAEADGAPWARRRLRIAPGPGVGGMNAGDAEVISKTIDELVEPDVRRHDA